MNRKPQFVNFCWVGPSIIYPVTVNVGGRQWEDREIVVPLKEWRAGERTFYYRVSEGGFATRYTCTPKVCAGIQHTIETINAYWEAAQAYKMATERATQAMDAMMALQNECEGLYSDYYLR